MEKEKLTFQKTIAHLQKKRKVLLLSTSNRWSNENEKPKSSLLAEKILRALGKKATLIDVSALNIYPCEGNISTERGNSCGPKSAKLKDNEKNPTGNHRCWASFNHQDDELWKISKELFESDCVVFFGSVRWGQMNSCYQKLIERLTWIENRHSTLGEDNLLKNVEAGVIILGHNWRGKEVLEVQKKVLDFFGFKIVDSLCWNWQYTKNPLDETSEGYKKDAEEFAKIFLE